MVIMGGVDVVEGDNIEILGRTYVLDLDHSLAGDFVVWTDEKSHMRIYATPNFDGMEGVPIQLDYDYCNIDTSCYEGKIDSYDHYKQIVKELVEKLLINLPKCKCVSRKETGEHLPINVKGWNFDLCGNCYKVIRKGERGTKYDDDNVETNGEMTVRKIGGIDIKEGDKLEILGKTYVLHIENELSGEHAVWIEEKGFMRIYATPNFEIDGVPAQVDYDDYNITTDGYHGKIDSYDHYKQIVKEMAEKILVNLPECKCESKNLEWKIVPIRVEGWNMYQCRQCGGIINGNQNMLKREDIVEELSQMMDRYFEEKAQEIKIKSGDIAPEQSFAIDDAVEKLADIVIRWAEQNQEIKEKTEDKKC